MTSNGYLRFSQSRRLRLVEIALLIALIKPSICLLNEEMATRSADELRPRSALLTRRRIQRAKQLLVNWNLDHFRAHGNGIREKAPQWIVEPSPHYSPYDYPTGARPGT
jgi:hypothetical protein